MPRSFAVLLIFAAQVPAAEPEPVFPVMAWNNVPNDPAVMKRMRFPWLWGTEGASAQLKGEFFNLFNRVNLTQVNNNLSNPLFGKSTSTYGARDVQFSLRVQF